MVRKTARRHEALPAAARVRVRVRRFPGRGGRQQAGPQAPAVPRPLAGRGAQGVPHGALLAGVRGRERGVHPEPAQLPEAHQVRAHHARAGRGRAVRVHDVRRHRGHHRVPGPPALAVRRPRRERVLLRPVPVGRHHRCLAVLLRVHHRPVRRLRVRHVLHPDHLQVSLPAGPRSP